MKQFLEYKDELISIRRQIHANPELSFKEFETSKYVCGYLEDLGLNYKKVADTGVLAELNSGKEGPTIALRCDMDALSINEVTDASYKSNNDGIMHACGHDAHLAILLVTVKYIVENIKEFCGRIIFVFQHAEELPPGGAVDFIESKLLDGVDYMYGLHVNAFAPNGIISTAKGPLLSSVDKFAVEIIGKGGHVAMPHITIDPIVITSQIINNLQSVISRNVDPLDSLILSVGYINGGTDFNVIPGSVTFGGTVRALSSENRELAERRFRQIVTSTAEMNGAVANITYDKGYPVLVNDDEAVSYVKKVTEKYISRKLFSNLEKPIMAAEDFASYTKKYKSCFSFLGTACVNKPQFPTHNAKFDLNEEALINGVKLFVGLFLEHNSVRKQGE